MPSEQPSTTNIIHDNINNISNKIKDMSSKNGYITHRPTVMASITDQIGQTPLVRLNRVPQSLGIEATVYAKLEFFNAGGSIKDRIALRMIEEAEREGRIKPGDTLIEPTSGNTYGFPDSF